MQLIGYTADRMEGFQYMSTKKSILSYIGILAGVCICIATTIFFYGMHQKQNIKNIGKSADAKDPLQVLVLGDSIWDLVRDDTGVAALLEKELGNAVVYNLAIKGTQATDTGAEDTSLIAMTEYITGKRECALPDDVEAKNILPEVPYEQLFLRQKSRLRLFYIYRFFQPNPAS